MANALYDKGREAFLTKLLDWNNDNIKVVLVDTNNATPYAVDIANHQYLSDIPAGARIATSGNLTGKSALAGVAKASDVTLTAVSGVTAEAVVIYQDTGTAATSRLIAYIDTGTGFPLTPSGGDVVVRFNTGATGIFKL